MKSWQKKCGSKNAFFGQKSNNQKRACLLSVHLSKLNISMTDSDETRKTFFS